MSPDKTSIHPDTSIQDVALRVPSLERSQAFYTEILGLQPQARENQVLKLGPKGGPSIVILIEDPSARPPANRTTGLYHMAIRVPTRRDLAATLARLIQARWPLQGFADHQVSEAIYLGDPDGNGIEVYRDRPRESWAFQNGQVQMTTDPLDTDSLLGELTGQPVHSTEMPAGTVMGHVHLKVAHIPEAVNFYTEVLGFELMQRYGPSAAFVAAGGYHHHIGMNIWTSAGAPPPTPQAAGLSYFTVHLPDTNSLEALRTRLRSAQIPAEERASTVIIQDPSGNTVVLAAPD